MYVLLLDEHMATMKTQLMIAVHARLAGNEKVQLPNLGDARQQWEDWLDSEPEEGEDYGSTSAERFLAKNSDYAERVTEVSEDGKPS